MIYPPHAIKSNPWRFWQVCGPNPEDFPYHYPLVEIWREEYKLKTFVLSPIEMAPEFNVANLFWRPFQPIHDGP